MLAELRNDYSPVEVVTNEHQFSHRPMRMGMTVLVVLSGRACRFHGAGNTAPDTLHQQVPCRIAHMGEAFDAQDGFVCCDDTERLVECVRSLGGLAAQHKREPARIFFVHMRVRQQAVFVRAETRMRVPIAVPRLPYGGRHPGARRRGAKLVEV